MAKFNTSGARPVGSGPMTTDTSAPTTRTHEGAPAHVRDAKSELFLLAVSNMVGEDTFYESATDRDQRFRSLVRQVARTDPIWLYNMLIWLRESGNMRSAPVVGAVEAVRTWLADGTQIALPTDPSTTDGTRGISRALVDEVCKRADEPGELLAYWTSRYGRTIPKPVKRGLADATRRLYREYQVLKYDTATRGSGGGYRFADVIELVHTRPDMGWQSSLYKYAIDKRHGRADLTVPDALTTIRNNQRLREQVATEPAILLSADAVREAGMTWEDVLSLGGQHGLPKARLWESVIPTMGHMALLRNLRNFDEADIDGWARRIVEEKISDPEQVARGRQFPFRYYSAYQASQDSLSWGPFLERAINASVNNIPALPGRSLVLVDTSASMTNTGVSKRSRIRYVEAAALFGVALAKRNAGRVDLHGFATGQFEHRVPASSAVLTAMTRLVRRIGEVGHSTQITDAVRRTYKGHDRVFIISDEQTHLDSSSRYYYGTSVGSAVPSTVPIYAFNLGGYRPAALDTSPGTNRHQLGGLTDATFRMVPLIEAGHRAAWPWEQPQG